MTEENKLKKYTCPDCGSPRFIRYIMEHHLVDFSKEGGIEGHPLLQIRGKNFHSLVCTKCNRVVPDGEAIRMNKEIL